MATKPPTSKVLNYPPKISLGLHPLKNSVDFTGSRSRWSPLQSRAGQHTDLGVEAMVRSVKVQHNLVFFDPQIYRWKSVVVVTMKLVGIQFVSIYLRGWL